jgi:hypothetical protein
MFVISRSFAKKHRSHFSHLSCWRPTFFQNLTTSTMGLLCDDHRKIMEMTPTATKSRCVADEFDDEDIGTCTSCSSSISSGSHCVDDVVTPPQHHSPQQIRKILTIPPEWIYGSLPTDKEYGQWIRSQFSSDHSFNKEERKERQWNHYQHQSLELVPEDNPWNRLRQCIQNVVVEGISKVTFHEHAHGKVHDGAEIFGISGDEKGCKTMTCIELACYRRDGLPKGLTLQNTE